MHGVYSRAVMMQRSLHLPWLLGPPVLSICELLSTGGVTETGMMTDDHASVSHPTGHEPPKDDLPDLEPPPALGVATTEVRARSTRWDGHVAEDKRLHQNQTVESVGCATGAEKMGSGL